MRAQSCVLQPHEGPSETGAYLQLPEEMEMASTPRGSI